MRETQFSAFVSKSNVDNGHHISSDKNKSLERFVCVCVCGGMYRILYNTFFFLFFLLNVNVLELRKLFFSLFIYMRRKIDVSNSIGNLIIDKVFVFQLLIKLWVLDMSSFWSNMTFVIELEIIYIHNENKLKIW